MIKSGQVIAGITISRDATGALAAPSTGPAGVLYVNGVANAATVTISGANPYKWSVTLPTLVAGDLVQMYITATVATIATAAVVWQDVADTKRVSDLVDSAYAGGAVASVSGDVGGDVGGKVLGGGSSTITGIGAWVAGAAGAVVALVGSVMGKSPATLDWSTDVSNKPTIGTAMTGEAATAVTGLATATNVSDVLAKLKKWLQLLFRKDAAIATDNATELGEINATGGSGAGAFNNVTDSTEALADKTSGLTAQETADALKLAPTYGSPAAGSVNKHLDDILEDTGTTLPASIAGIVTTVSISTAVAAAISAGKLVLTTHHTWRQTVISTSTLNLAAATKLWLAIKEHVEDTDDDALALIEKTGGLTRLVKTAYTTIAHGSLVVTGSSGAWNITGFLHATPMGLLTAYATDGLPAEIKAQVGGDDVAVWTGTATILRGVVQTL
jgi:hypothetical protein